MHTHTHTGPEPIGHHGDFILRHCDESLHTLQSVSTKPVDMSANFSDGVCECARVNLSFTCTATHCNTLQHTATHCNTLQHTATHCNALQHTATLCNTLQSISTKPADMSANLSHGVCECALVFVCVYGCQGKKYAVIYMHCHALQHTATHHNTLQNTATCCNMLQHTVTHCNTLQHTQYTAQHCYRPQHTVCLCVCVDVCQLDKESC